MFPIVRWRKYNICCISSKSRLGVWKSSLIKLLVSSTPWDKYCSVIFTFCPLLLTLWARSFTPLELWSSLSALSVLVSLLPMECVSTVHWNKNPVGGVPSIFYTASLIYLSPFFSPFHSWHFGMFHRTLNYFVLKCLFPIPSFLSHYLHTIWGMPFITFQTLYTFLT